MDPNVLDTADLSSAYYLRLAAAFVRGELSRTNTRPLATLSDDECAQLLRQALSEGLSIHAFKRSRVLPRVGRVIGALRGMAPATLLDVGSGRGVALWPLLDALPTLDVTASDSDRISLGRIRSVRAGGIDTLTPCRLDATSQPFARASFDVVTLLEVLEHIPNAQYALDEATRVARRFVILTVPSHEDDNPEHIHLFTKQQLESMLSAAGASRVQVEYILNHMVVVARIAR